jgi:hypothetical protein
VQRENALVKKIMNENYNIHVEKTVLSTLLFSPEKLNEYKKELEPNIFWLVSHRDIYETMLHLHDREIPIDEEFIKRELEKQNKFNPDIMIEVISANATSSSMQYIKELQELHIKREIHDATIRFQHGEIDHVKLSSIIEKSKNIYAKSDVQQATKQEYKYLTPFMNSLLYELKEINNYPDSMVWSVMLASMAGLIGARAKVTNGVNVTVFPVVWAMIVAPSSLAAKSTLYNATKECIFGDMQKKFYDEYREEKANYKHIHKGYMALPKEEKLQEDEPEPPTLKQIIFAPGGTPEAKIKNLEHNPHGGVVYFDEMKAELEKANANQEYKALKTSMFDGAPYHKELVNSGTIILDNPVLSEVGLITDKWLLEATHKNDVASGFMARYLFSVNPKTDFEPLQIRRYTLDKEKYSKVSEFVLEMFSRCEDPLMFRLSNEAMHKYENWFNEYSKTSYHTETDEEIASSVRLSTYVLKFMLISYIFNNAYNKLDVVASNMFTIGVEYFDEALEIMEIFRQGSDKVLSLFDSSNKLNYKIEDYAMKIYKKIDKSESRKITRSEANNIRGVNKQKIDHLIETGMLISTKTDRTEYLSKP